MNCPAICVACRKRSAVNSCVYLQMSAVSMNLKLSKIYHANHYVSRSNFKVNWVLKVGRTCRWLVFTHTEKAGLEINSSETSQVLVWLFGSDQWVFVLWLPPWHVTSQHLETLPSCKIHIWLMRRRKWLVNFNICHSLPPLMGEEKKKKFISYPVVLCAPLKAWLWKCV